MFALCADFGQHLRNRNNYFASFNSVKCRNGFTGLVFMLEVKGHVRRIALWDTVCSGCTKWFAQSGRGPSL